MARSILVTNADGSLGCGVLRLLRAMHPEGTRIVGLASTPVSAANHLCDHLILTPSTYHQTDGADIAFLEGVCASESVELILPTTDWETYHLKRAQNRLPWVACSDADVSLAFYDKHLTSQLFSRLGIPFAPSCLPSEEQGAFQSPFVKARFGGLSRDVFPNCQNPRAFSDDYVVQEALGGQEVTAAFYVTKSKRVHGTIAFTRSLRFGSTIQCETTDVVDEQIHVIAEMLASKGNVVGSCNLQGKICDGRFVVFEVNGRVSGTASIRAQFGFEDVRYLVEEYLFDEQPTPCVIRRGSAVRMMTDVIYPGRTLSQVVQDPGACQFF
ncbi:hypothetical protein HZA87_01600 [Candidatus Uhrbacteria bacterium]|nr:hypothetical protein [Candidatus Uhrbacteria bacterium]